MHQQKGQITSQYCEKTLLMRIDIVSFLVWEAFCTIFEGIKRSPDDLYEWNIDIYDNLACN